jgi:hypothetical protein
VKARTPPNIPLRVIDAKYKGKDGLFNYVFDRVYTLYVTGNKINRTDGTGVCEYADIQAFLSNWQIVTVLGEAEILERHKKQPVVRKETELDQLKREVNVIKYELNILKQKTAKG